MSDKPNERPNTGQDPQHIPTKNVSEGEITDIPSEDTTSRPTTTSANVDPTVNVQEELTESVAHKFDVKHEEPSLNDTQPPPKTVVPEFENLGELPEHYGTGKLYLVARDPYFLFAYWDLTGQQLKDAENQAHDNKVFFQLYHENKQRIQQIQIFPGSREWNIDVHQPNTTFYAEIGYYNHDGHFTVVSQSNLTTTPRDTVSANLNTRFVTIPFNYPFRELAEIVATHRQEGEELANTLARLQEEEFPLPFDVSAHKQLAQEDQKYLLEAIAGEMVRRINMGSFEITELMRHRFADLISSGQWVSSEFSPAGASWFGGKNHDEDFFMHVNAELIVYGGTRPNAKMRIDGKEIATNPDGTFHYHFNFKDGSYHIPIEAESVENNQKRSALLSFFRLTERSEGTYETPQEHRPSPIDKHE